MRLQFHMWILSNSNCVQLVVYLFQKGQLLHCDELISARMKRHLSTIRSLSDAFPPYYAVSFREINTKKKFNMQNSYYVYFSGAVFHVEWEREVHAYTGDDHMIYHGCPQLPTHQKEWKAAG